MIKQYLHDEWMLERENEVPIPAKVPGSVYGDLLLQKKMEDPFYRDNEDPALSLMEENFTYRLTFIPESELLSCGRILLRCEGLDTIAQISLNGSLLGEAENMHRIWEFDVSGRVKDGENELEVLFFSPLKYIREAYAACESNGSEDAMRGFTHIRKAHCMFGWDWGPRLPDAGIWRDISLVGIRTARIENFYVTQRHEGEHVYLKTKIELENEDGVRFIYGKDPAAGTILRKCDNLLVKGILTAPDGTQTIYENLDQEIEVKDPQLWWPNGLGEQPLYSWEILLFDTAGKIDSENRRIGLRTMTVRREKDQFGESFAHEVNGLTVFAMGADYIPQDNILGRVTPESIRELLEQCKAANFNSIRVWGGGHYPSDTFYDVCDELGLIVWQDFMFACGVYELTEEFEKNILAEFKDNIKRIRHHASLGLWCGNNEMEMFVKMGVWVSRPKQAADYIKMYEYLIPKILKEHDPNTFYWPASPSSGGSFDEPNDENRGDVHYWDVWHGNKPFSEYRKFFFRYVSEFGFQSFPAEKTIETFTLPEDRNVFSYVMEKHQRNASANGKLMNYLYQTFLYPNHFSTVIYATQLLQAEAIKYGVEHFRRNRGRCMGAVYWQLNDCWPVASWASIDYYGRWKALHYFAKRFFTPLLLSCEEEGLMTQDPNVNCEREKPVEKSIRLNLSNETREEQKTLVKWSLRNAKSEILEGGEQEIVVPAFSAVWLDKKEFPDADLHGTYVSYELWQKGEMISEGTVIFSLPKFFAFQNPGLTYKVEGDMIIVTAENYARSVEIRNEQEDMILSDNYFDMNAGEKRVKIISGSPEGIRLRSVWDIR